MKKPVSSEILANEIYESVELISQIGDLRIRQLIKLLEETPDEIIVEGILIVFTNTIRPDSLYIDQKYACRILKELNPSCHLPLTTLLKLICKKWNVSVYEFVVWIKNQFEVSAIENTIDLLKAEGLSPNEHHQIKTFLFYLNSDLS